ncbi:serine/threonine-protein kinase STY17 [Pelomyxa schiedti]|nr:serine/threonine-protein kinase STY17 [Pelomyxa schiedti]
MRAFVVAATFALFSFTFSALSSSASNWDCTPAIAACGPGLSVFAHGRFLPNTTAVRPCQAIVCGGAAQSGFADTLQGARQPVFVDPAYPTAQLLWQWVPPAGSPFNDSGSYSCEYVADFIPRLGVSGSTYTASTAVGTVVSVKGLPSQGTLQMQPNYFNATVSCAQTDVISLSFQIAISCDSFGDVSAFESVSFAIPWQCTKPGCSAYCEPTHGYCDSAHGTCICQPPWTGTTCEIMFSYPKALCPGDPLKVSYYIPPQVHESNSILNVLYVRTSHNTVVIEGRYFLHWSDQALNSTDPDAAFALNGTSLLPGYYPPGTYVISIYNPTTSFVYLQGAIVVKDWSLCGYTNVTCGSNTSNRCGAEENRGSCINGKCVCNTAFFWYDCSRGCPGIVNITDSSATIWSDTPPDGKVESMYYLRKIICRWLIKPEGSYDTITLNFTNTYVLPPDYINVYSIDTNGIDMALVTSLNDNKVVEVAGKSAFVELGSGPNNTWRGFIMTYSTKKNPIPKGTLIFSILIAALVGIIILMGAGFMLYVYIQKQKKRIRELRETPALTMPLIMTEEEIEEKCGQNAKECEEKNSPILDEVGIQLDKFNLDFGIEGNSAPVQKETLRDKLTLWNKSSSSIAYQFVVPDDQYILTCSIRPGVGKIPARRSVTVNVECVLRMTTNICHPVKLEIIRNGANDGEGILATAYIYLALEGVLSPWINPDDIEVEPEPVASGGFGYVYKGTYKGREIAMKALLRQETFDKEEIASFEKECKLMSQLHHPCIIQFVGASHLPLKFCILTEWVPLGSLSRLLRYNPFIEDLLLIKYGSEIGEAMAYLHDNNILYRDLKCSNVLVVSDSLDETTVGCKLTDFDTARNVDNPGLTLAYTKKLGTCLFMAPELFAPPWVYNNKVDVYSFSLCLWEMWAHQEPWGHVETWDVPGKVRAGERPSFDDFQQPCPPGIQELIQKCWAQNSAERPEFHAIVNELGGIADTLKEETKNSRHRHRHHHRHHHHRHQTKKAHQTRQKKKINNRTESTDTDSHSNKRRSRSHTNTSSENHTRHKKKKVHGKKKSSSTSRHSSSKSDSTRYSDSDSDSNSNSNSNSDSNSSTSSSRHTNTNTSTSNSSSNSSN